MPHEKRFITFDLTECYKALYSLCSQKKIKKPGQGVVVKVEAMKNDPFRIVMELKHEHDGTLRQEEYSRDFLAAALMLYCKGCGIPLPKNANKSVSLKGGEIVLCVTI